MRNYIHALRLCSNRAEANYVLALAAEDENLFINQLTVLHRGANRLFPTN